MTGEEIVLSTPVGSFHHRTLGGIKMPDDKMRDNDLNQQAGNRGSEDKDYGQKSPGRNPQDDQSTGQRTGGGNEPHEGGGGMGQSGRQGQQDQDDMGQQRR